MAPTTSSTSVEFLVRIASSLILIAIAVASIYFGGLVFAAWCSIAAGWALREWHRLVNNGRLTFETIPSAISVAAVCVLMAEGAALQWSVLAIAAGVVAVAIVAIARKAWAVWHALGPIYLGVPAMALIALRELDPRHGILLGGVLMAVWAADTGALVIGKLLGGPKLAPTLSPNKTWAGFVGGIISAAITEAVYAYVFHGSLGPAATFGVLLALAGHCGDLFESWVKRRCQAKVTGNLIPGHGGMLDRIDSLLFAAPVAALIALVAGLDPLFGSIH